MTLLEFESLEINDQYSAVWEYGVHVGERFDGVHKLILYQIFSFYVEIYYSVDSNRITTLGSFSNVKCLDAYLPSINISNIHL